MDKQIEIQKSEGAFVDLLNKEIKELQTRKKQIEAMAKDMLEYGMKKYPTGESVFTETKLREQFYHVFLTYAEYLINKGYCKSLENAVVISRAEYNDLRGLEKHFDDYLIKEIVETRKETAKKFAERLKNDVSEDNELHEALNFYLKRDYFEYIDERCKEFTGEMK